jgi:undecaprenyl-diphosphatase
MTTTEAIILAIVEGLTEYLPISSTGHLILADSMMNIEHTKFSKVYLIAVQFGAILSVLVLYWRRFLQSMDFYYKLLIAFIPAAILGKLLNDVIDGLLESPLTVGISMFVGGVVLVFIDKWFAPQIEDAKHDPDFIEVRETNEFGIEERKMKLNKLNVSYMQAFIIGCFQCIAMIPGVSRSASTIVGGLVQKLNMKRAAEFSFFLAVPTIFAASAYKFIKVYDDVRATDIELLAIGNLVSFIVGIIAIRFFISLLTRYGLKYFGYYRIVVGLAIIILLLTGHSLNLVD